MPRSAMAFFFVMRIDRTEIIHGAQNGPCLGFFQVLCRPADRSRQPDRGAF